MTDVRGFLAELNGSYCALHARRLDALWRAFMALTSDRDAARAEMDVGEVEYRRFLHDPARLAAVAAQLAEAEGDPTVAPSDLVALRGWLATFRAHAIPTAEARALADDIVAQESELARARASLELGYDDPRAGFVRASFVELNVMLDGESDPVLRRAAWDGLRSIESHVLANGFIELVRMRNRLGRMLGGEDFYDWKVRSVEGMTKAEVFDLLDELEAGTRDAATRGFERLVAAHGPEAMTPWNARYLSSGDVTREQDPYFPLEKAIARWGTSFAALGVGFRGAELVLDLLDREGKFENGFMSGPEVAWVDRGEHRSARIHFTANAIPGRVGSGFRAFGTLFHEGGHAAHFSNIEMPAPCFGQEQAPTSVAFSETQSMLLESLINDADWMVRYARTASGAAMPVDLIERGIRARQPFAARALRTRLAICYGERAIYEIPDTELTAERILEELRSVERRLTLLDEGSSRPVLSVPHLLAGDSSAYYHGYLLAKIAVHQTRDYFMERDGYLVDNPAVGPALRESYWKPGNSRSFTDFVRGLTGAPLSAAALARDLTRTPDEAIADARARIRRLAGVPAFDGEIDLDADIRIVHGNETVAEVREGGFQRLAGDFESWIRDRVHHAR